MPNVCAAARHYINTAMETRPKTATTMSFDGKVLIAGAGLAGLALANVLQHHGIPYEIFERDTDADARDQGFSLNIHFCLEPLGKSIDPAKFSKFGHSCAVDPEHPENARVRLIDGMTSKYIDDQDPARRKKVDQNINIYRVCRSRLRSWLMQGIDVQWNKQIDRYTATPGDVRVTFTDGSQAVGTVLVGADGVNSAVCEQLLGPEEFRKCTATNPVSTVSATYWMDQSTRDIYAKFAKTHMIVVGRYQELFVRMFVSLVDVDRTAGHDKPRYKMMWLVSCIDPGYQPAPEQITPQRLLDRAKTLVNQFDAPFRNLVHNTPEDAPVNRWVLRERSPPAILETHPEYDRVVLIGDAAHAMTPYKGEGYSHFICSNNLYLFNDILLFRR